MERYKMQDGTMMHDTGCRMQDVTPLSPPLLRGELKGGIVHRELCIMHRDEKGIALVMVMVLSTIALAIMAALIYMLTSGTQISGMQKRYKTALEAGFGGADVSYDVIGVRGNPNIPNIGFALNVTDACLTSKLNSATSSWTTCAASASNVTVGPTDHDWSFQLGTIPQYTVYAKIVDTVPGNSGASQGLVKSGVVNSNSGEVTVQSIPYLYTIELDAENANNPQERAKLSILYQY